jgi:cytochrome b6-f complex iron-sulfur subunit
MADSNLTPEERAARLAAAQAALSGGGSPPQRPATPPAQDQAPERAEEAVAEEAPERPARPAAQASSPEDRAARLAAAQAALSGASAPSPRPREASEASAQAAAAATEGEGEAPAERPRRQAAAAAPVSAEERAARLARAQAMLSQAGGSGATPAPAAARAEATPPPEAPAEEAAPVAAAPERAKVITKAKQQTAPAEPAAPRESPEERAARIARARELAAGGAAAPAAARVQAAGPATVAQSPRRQAAKVERARLLQTREVTRRTILRNGFFAGLAVMTTGFLALFLDFFNLRNPTGFGGTVTVPANQVPAAGADPVKIAEGKFWLANLEPGQGDPYGLGSQGGLIALYQKCPHLGCVVPWRGDFSFGSEAGLASEQGWFRCPCHGSTYSRAGVRVFGPAPRSMDTMTIEVLETGGAINVLTGTALLADHRGGTGSEADNPLRAVPYEAGATGGAAL